MIEWVLYVVLNDLILLYVVPNDLVGAVHGYWRV
jgi:hypothetical protein